LNAFRQAVAALGRCQPEVLVVAGDTFDSIDVEPAIIDEAAKTLSSVRENGDAIPVVLIPGNHDPADADKLWTAFEACLDGSGNVRLIREPQVIVLAEGKLLVEAYPCLTRYSPGPPWEERLHVARRDPASVRVVVAHGTLQGGPVPEDDTDAYPFTQAELESLGADYAALGHFHGLYPAWGDGDECQRSFSYCGAHEPDQFGGEAGYAILADVTAGQAPRLTRIKTGQRQWRLIPLAGPADLEQLSRLLDTLRAEQEPNRHVIRIKVQSGIGWAAADVDRLTSVEEAVRALGAHLERRGEIKVRADVDSLDLTDLPSGAVKEALLALKLDFEQSEEPPAMTQNQTAEPCRREVLATALQLGWERIQDRAAP
jgi:DNA repair exonuclease SbcCD nuclease subunit